nr:heterogeneous nuclear ribonucleoproteins C1/C2-like isoform X2 [Nerophis lumbriciformis]
MDEEKNSRTEMDLDYDSYEDYYDRVYDYQRVPASMSPLHPMGPSPSKRSRSSSYLSSKQRRSRDRSHSKSCRTHSTSSSTSKLGTEELQVIKKELTMIKTQIDGLLDSLDRMDTHKNDHKESLLREESPGCSLYSSSPEHSLSSLSPPSSRHRIHRESSVQRGPDDEHHVIRAMAAFPSPLTTHVLNTANGVPGSNMALSLHRLDPSSETWMVITTGMTNSDGRCPGLITQEMFLSGVYKLHFETAPYWDSLGETSFYPYVEIVFTIKDPSQKYHIPLLLSRFSYSTYRGS